MAENYNEFTQGVEPGGLRSREENRILICYLVAKLRKPITQDMLCDTICAEGISNYFELKQSLSDVIESNNVYTDSDGYLFLTVLGKKNLSILEHDLPYSIREKALNSVVNAQTKQRQQQDYNIEIEALDKGYNVTVSVLDSNEKLMSTTIFVADYEQALKVKEKFNENPVKIYSEIISLLMA